MHSVDIYPPSHLAVSSSSFPGPCVLWVSPQGQGLSVIAEVRARLTQDHIQQGTGRLLHTQRGLPWIYKHIAMYCKFHLIENKPFASTN